MSDSLDYLTFQEPSLGSSSRQFLTQSYEVHSADGPDRFYKPGESCRLEISGQSQNSFILPRTMKLVYHAVSNIQTLEVDPGYAADDTVSLTGVFGIKQLPGCPFYGAPHLSSVSTEVPGLSSNLSAMNGDGQSQRWYAQRLLCSGDEGSCAVPGYKSTFGQRGRLWSAGGRDMQARCDAVTGSFWRNLDGAVVRDYHLGGFQRYDVPASAFFDLADGASSALPLPYLTSSSSNLIVRANFAPVSSAVVTNNKLHAADLVTYVVGGVSLQWTAVNIVDSAILAQVQALFRGEISLAIAEDMAIPVPMTLSHRAFRFSSTTLSAPSGSFSIRVPAGKAACNAVMIRFDGYFPEPTTQGLPDATKYLVSAKPIIKGLVLRVGSARFPAREISDVYEVAPAGLGAKWALATTLPANPTNVSIGGATFIATSDAIAAEQYKQGRQFFSLSDNDKYDCSPAAELFDCGSGPSGMSTKFASFAPPGDKYGQAQVGGVTGASNSLFVPEETQASANMFIFNLQAFLPEMSLRERGYAISGVDLRNQSDVTIEGTIVGTCPSGVNLTPSPQVAWGACQSWDISTAMAYTELATLLPSRSDLEASASLLPSAAGSVASGGVM